MVVPTGRTGFRIAARPDARIDGIPGGAGLQWMCCHQVLQPRQRHCTRVEGIVDAAPSTLEAGREAQMDGMFDDRGGQQGIEDLDQSITTTAKGGIHGLTKGAQPLKGICVHAVSMPKRAFLVYPSSPAPCCWLNGKLRGKTGSEAIEKRSSGLAYRDVKSSTATSSHEIRSLIVIFDDLEAAPII
jgi:hypothetical protein